MVSGADTLTHVVSGVPVTSALSTNRRSWGDPMTTTKTLTGTYASGYSLSPSYSALDVVAPAVVDGAQARPVPEATTAGLAQPAALGSLLRP